MNAAHKMRSPRGSAKASKKRREVSFLYHATHTVVKHIEMVCGLCICYREKVGNRGRRHCAYLGESASYNGQCKVDPRDPAFEKWLEECEARDLLEVTA